MYEDEEWDDTSDTIETECDHCGETRLCRLEDDPFIAEIYPESPNELSYWCRPCYCNSLYDI
jgi:hypothetical protein